MNANGNGDRPSRQRKRSYDPSKHCGGECADGQPCTRGKGQGTDHPGFGNCKLHTGATPNGRKSAMKERARGEFGALVEQCEIVVQGRSIEEALDDVIERCGAMALAWFQIVCQLQEKADWEWVPQKGPQGSLQRWVTVSVEGLVGPSAQGEQRVHVADEQYRKWIGMYLQANKVAADLGLEERKVRVQEGLAATVQRAVDATLLELGLDPGDPRVRQVFARHLRLVEGAA